MEEAVLGLGLGKGKGLSRQRGAEGTLEAEGASYHVGL